MSFWKQLHLWYFRCRTLRIRRRATEYRSRMWTINNRVCTRYNNRMACTPGTYSPLRCTTIMVSFKRPKKVNLNVVLSFVSNQVFIFTFVSTRRYERSLKKKKTYWWNEKSEFCTRYPRRHGFRILVHLHSLQERVLSVVSEGGSESPPKMGWSSSV